MPAPIYHLDYESTSLCDISLGAYRYAVDPSTRTLMFAIAKDDGEPLVWRFDDPFGDEALAAEAMLREALVTGALIYAHNAQFEVALSTSRMVPDLGLTPPSLDVWRCTQAMCKRAAAPESLAAAAEFFGLGARKNHIGKALIAIFSDQSKVVTLSPPPGMIDPDTVKPMKNGKVSKGTKPKTRKSASPILENPVPWDWLVKAAGQTMTVREAWEAFCGYCKTDVRVEQQLHTKLAHFELKGDQLASFQFDLRMNFRGVPVNMQALVNADRVVEEYKTKLEARFLRMCGFGSGQRERVLGWLRERGYPEEDLTAGTVTKVLAAPPETMSPMAVEVLKTRALLSFAALKKIPTMRDAAGPDHRVRGTGAWHAARTGRSAGRIIQPQNFKKSTIEHSALCYQMLCEGWELDWFEEMWDSPLEAIASSIRHFIQPKDGRRILDADYTGVEARITPWLAGDTGKLKSILAGVDPYKRIASQIFGVEYVNVTGEQRTIAKPVELGCCFGVGGKGLMEALANPPYNVTRTRKECNEYVKVYRENHPETVQAWRDIEEAARQAIRAPGQRFHACANKLSFICGRVAGIPYLVVTLPSGRNMYYPHPQVKAAFKEYEEEDMLEDAWKREKGGYWIDQISFYGKLRESAQWGRVGTWGSRLFENFVQATGADLLNYGMICAEAAGYDIFMCVHDQALAEDNGLSVEGYVDALCQKQPWAADFPLEAKGTITPFYLKD